MQRKEVSIVFLDLDGTILRSDKSISPHTKDVLARCREKGIRIAVATARSETAAKRYTDILQPDLIISNGGALVRQGETAVHQCMLSAEASNDIVATVMRSRDLISVSVETEKGYYATWGEPNSPDYAHAIHYDFEIPLGLTTYKITAELKAADLAEKLAMEYPECGMMKFSDGQWYRFAHRDASKMNGVRAAARFFGLDIAQAAAFGDDYNDIDMIEGCGFGIAMGNAIGAVKAAADGVCDLNDRDGVATWLEENIF